MTDAAVCLAGDRLLETVSLAVLQCTLVFVSSMRKSAVLQNLKSCSLSSLTKDTQCNGLVLTSRQLT